MCRAQILHFCGVSLRFMDLLKPACGSGQVLAKSWKSSNSIPAKCPSGNGEHTGHTMLYLLYEMDELQFVKGKK